MNKSYKIGHSTGQLAIVPNNKQAWKKDENVHTIVMQGWSEDYHWTGKTQHILVSKEMIGDLAQMLLEIYRSL